MRTIALLPMKGNSERVPGKNFKALGDKPLFMWMLDTLLAAPSIESVVINTDARAQLTKAGLDIELPPYDRVVLRDRKSELVGDFVSMNRVIEDDLRATEGDLYLMTHVTNPFISSTTIESAIERLRENSQADSLFAVNRFQTRFYSSEGDPINHDPNNLIRTQDLEPWFEENSCLYLFTKQSFASTQARIGLKPILFETPRLESVDIDEPEDWVVAASLATHFEGI